MDHLPNLSIEFLEGAADGLRLVSSANWSVECLVCSRSRLPDALRHEATSKWIDVPGVYLLIGALENQAEHEKSKDGRLYVGQADSVAERLASHLRNESKSWWRTAVILRRLDKNPLNLSHCKFIESRFCALAASRWVLTNKVSPQPAALSTAEQKDAEDFMQKSLTILNALGWNLFDSHDEARATKPAPEPGAAPILPANLQSLLEEIRLIVTGPSFPNSQWYWTQIPDYRAKFAIGDDFRVFARIRWTKAWLWLRLKDVGRYKISAPADLDSDVRKAIQEAYDKAKQYIHGGK